MGAASSQLQFCGCLDFSSAQGEYKKNLPVSGCNSLIQVGSPGFVKQIGVILKTPNTSHSERPGIED